mmetsp:Transcript_6177/g.11411  ORF Transcript_6177/g.11411 Transcript_6177/m.11411 type:complete len:223 (-) Transcript_6177:81-749(-)
MASRRFRSMIALIVAAVQCTSALEPAKPTRIECYSITEPCHCSAGSDQCCNKSTSPGVKNRGDADHCCCSADAPLIWGNPPAKCQEVKKCTYNCCPADQKLCADACCPPGDKCMLGVCSSSPKPTPTPSPRPAPAPGPPSRSWWEVIPGNGGLSVLVDLAMSSVCCGTGAVALPPCYRRMRQLQCPRLFMIQSRPQQRSLTDDAFPPDILIRQDSGDSSNEP